MPVEDNTIFTDDFQTAQNEHGLKNLGCKGHFLYRDSKMICQNCGQAWQRHSSIRDVYRERDAQRQSS